MSLEILKDYKIDNLITQEELDNIIHHMIKTYDKYQYFYKPYSHEERSIFETYTKKYKDIYNVLEKKAVEDENKKKEEREDNLFTEYYYDLYFEEVETPIWERVDKMFSNILRQIEPIANEKRDDRINHRIKERTVIDINAYEHSEYQNFIEFFHDGGWGVANKKGMVLISNRLDSKASMSSPIFSEYSYHSDSINNQLYKTTDRDTGLHGVISKIPLKRVLPCRFKDIKSIEGYRDRDYIFAFKVLAKNDLWGCYNDLGKRIAKCKYDIIDFNWGYVECGKGQFHLQDNRDGNGYTPIFDGIKDLYDTEGHLIVGGYTELNYDQLNKLYLFYFNTYKTPIPYYIDEWELEKYVTCYDDAKCLILNKDFNPLITHGNTCIKGTMIENIDSFPSSCLISGRIIEIHDNFIFSKEMKLEPIDSEEEMEINNFYREMENGHLYKESNITYITFINQKGQVEWKIAVDDYYNNWYSPILIQIENLIGFLNSNGVQFSSFDAISKDNDDRDRRYAAKIVRLSDEDSSLEDNNPNFIPTKNIVIQYYRIDFQDKPIRIEDNWEVFDPNNVSWFPNNFLEKMGIFPDDDDEFEDYYEDRSNEGGYEWTEEDTWDAMTDGMYGDYPGGDVDYEKFGF